jgi:hypothetical protein
MAAHGRHLPLASAVLGQQSVHQPRRRRGVERTPLVAHFARAVLHRVDVDVGPIREHQHPVLGIEDRRSMEDAASAIGAELDAEALEARRRLARGTAVQVYPRIVGLLVASTGG